MKMWNKLMCFFGRHDWHDAYGSTYKTYVCKNCYKIKRELK